MILDYIAFGYVLYRIGVPLILSLPDPRKFEEKRIQRLMQHDIWVHAKRAVFDFLLIGAAFLVAWRQANVGRLLTGWSGRARSRAAQPERSAAQQYGR